MDSSSQVPHDAEPSGRPGTPPQVASAAFSAQAAAEYADFQEYPPGGAVADQADASHDEWSDACVPRAETLSSARRDASRPIVPILLFLATCGSTFLAGATDWVPFDVLGDGEALRRSLASHGVQGLVYMAAVMSILLSHEMGHYLTARLYRVHASLPFFLPVPMHPLGTLGAVIGMRGTHANRRQLFDLGLAGPLAGLVAMVPFLWAGISQLDPEAAANSHLPLRNPLLLEYLLRWLRPDLPAAMTTHLLQLNPFLMASWVAMLVTGLNMLPISQLDGGHVLYALLGRRAQPVARMLLVASIALIVIFEQYHWSIMVVLLTLLGVDHPPTEDDGQHLDAKRLLLGLTSLALPVLCTPWFDVLR